MSVDSVIETLWAELVGSGRNVIVHSTPEGQACCHPDADPGVEYVGPDLVTALRLAVEDRR